MSVDMPDSLTAMWPGIEDNPVAILGNALGDGDLVGVCDHVGEQPVTGLVELGQGGEVPPRDHQDMYRRLRVDIAERDSPWLIGHDGRRNVAGDDGAKQTFRHAADLNVWQSGSASDIYGCSAANPRCTTALVQRPRQPSGHPSPNLG
jgi:hypothetical protein